MPIFTKSIFYADCDECERRFPVSSGGVCDVCRRILCNAHLHGSLARRVAVGMGLRIVCNRCRAQSQPPS